MDNRLFFLPALIVALAGVGCTPAPPGQPLKIGVIAMLSGENAANGRDMVEAASLAVERAGRALQDSGRPRPRLVVEDGMGVPEQAMEAARKLIYQERVQALVGPQMSRCAIPVARLAEQEGLVMIAPMSTNPETTAGKKWVFRIPYLDTVQGAVLARFAAQVRGAREAAVLYDAADSYSRTLAEVFRDTFTDLGGAVSEFASYTTDQARDFRAPLGRIARAEPEVLLLPNYAADARAQARQARAMGIRATLLGGDGWDTDSFAADPAFDGSFATRQFHPQMPGRETREFAAAFRSAYGRTPGDVAATTFDAVGLVLAAARQGGQADSASIRRGLLATPRYPGVTGALAYKGSGDPEKEAVVVRIDGGRAGVFAVVEAPP